MILNIGITKVKDIESRMSPPLSVAGVRRIQVGEEEGWI